MRLTVDSVCPSFWCLRRWQVITGVGMDDPLRISRAGGGLGLFRAQRWGFGEGGERYLTEAVSPTLRRLSLLAGMKRESK